MNTDDMTPQERRAETAKVMYGWELQRKHSKAKLLAMAYEGGLVRYNNPERWRKDEIAVVVLDQQLADPNSAGSKWVATRLAELTAKGWGES